MCLLIINCKNCGKSVDLVQQGPALSYDVNCSHCNASYNISGTEYTLLKNKDKDAVQKNRRP
jgi:hypothetical protein